MANSAQNNPAKYKLFKYFDDNAPQLRDMVIVEVRCTGYCPHYIPAKSRLNRSYSFLVITVGATCIFWYILIFINFIFYIFGNFVILKFKFP